MTHASWISFWLYFQKTWIKKYPPQLWNISMLSDTNVAGRTNNALERYNRRLGDHFAMPHPSLITFVSTIGREFDYFSILLNNIRTGREPSPNIDREYIILWCHAKHQ